MKTNIHIPAWAKEGNKIIETWEEPVVSGTTRGIKTLVKYLNKKKEEIIMTKWVKWDD